MDLFYGTSNTIVRGGIGWRDGSTAVVARVQPRAQAPGGLGKQFALGPARVIVRHDGACRLTLTPIIDGVVLDDLEASFDLAAPDTMVDAVIRRGLTQPVTWPGAADPFSRQALRGVFGTLRAELTPLEVATLDPAGAENALTFVAKALQGDAITIVYVDPAGPDEPLTVSVVGTAIEVSLATDGLGAITSTAAQVQAAIEAEEDADALVDVLISEDGPLGTGTGVVTAMGLVTLVAGTVYALGGFELGARAVGVGGRLIAANSAP